MHYGYENHSPSELREELLEITKRLEVLRDEEPLDNENKSILAWCRSSMRTVTDYLNLMESREVEEHEHK